MFNPSIRLVLSIGFLAAIISRASVSAVEFFHIRGRWDLSEACARTNHLCLPGNPSQSTCTHILTFERDSSRLAFSPHASARLSHVYVALASRDLTVIKNVFKLFVNNTSLTESMPVVGWDEEYPNLCFLGANSLGERSYIPQTFREFEEWSNRNARVPGAAFRGTFRSQPPDYPIKLMGPVKFQFQGRWQYFQDDLPLAHLYHENDHGYVFKLGHKTSLTLSDRFYSRAYVAIANTEMNGIKGIFVLDKDRRHIDIPFNSQYPNLCLLRVEKSGELRNHHPPIFNAYQDWLKVASNRSRIFPGTSPASVRRLRVSRVRDPTE